MSVSRRVIVSAVPVMVALALGLAPSFPAAAQDPGAPAIPDPVHANPNYPSFSRQALPGGNMVTWAVIDTGAMDVFVTTAGGPSCDAPGPNGQHCAAPLSHMVQSVQAAGGMGANFTDYTVPLGLVVVNHQELAKANPNTVSLCIGDRGPKSGKQVITVGTDADAGKCNFAVSGEGLVNDGKPAIQGLADAGHRGKFWWSVEPHSAVERQLVGVRKDGRIILAVATSATPGKRGGMSLPDAATFLIKHGAVAAIGLDGGHLADLYETGPGDVVPAESAAGHQPIKVALVFKPRTWVWVPLVTPAPTPAAPTPPPPSSPAPDAPPPLPHDHFVVWSF